MTEPSAIDAARVDAQMSLAREWDELVEQVRQLDGFADFLKRPRIESLLSAATDGPVAVINVSKWRCDALLIRPSGVTLCPLPDLTLDHVAEWANDYLRKLQAVDISAQRLSHAGHAQEVTYGAGVAQYAAALELRSAELAANEMLLVLQELLWETVAEPVLTKLGFDGPPAEDTEWPRLWWCPTGPLTLLPLHAAGCRSGGYDIVLDRVVSSYTPTLRALIEARRPRAGAKQEGAARLLIVSADNLPGQASLRGARAEQILLESLTEESRRTVLAGPVATREAVARELQSHSWVHFGCHGQQDVKDPSRAGLVLTDGTLTVLDLAANVHDGELAGLSACKTAVGGVDLLDEAITLAAALHYNGYRHVVAALWSISDKAAAVVFSGLYQALLGGGRFDALPAAVTLHRAVRGLRDEYRDQPWRWASFIHMGP